MSSVTLISSEDGGQVHNDLLNQASLGAFSNRLLTVMIAVRTCEKASCT
jgi:hypothetical protein